MNSCGERFAVRIKIGSKGEEYLQLVQVHGTPLTRKSLKHLRQKASQALVIANKRFEHFDRETNYRGESVILRVKLFAHMAAAEARQKLESLLGSLRLKFIRMPRTNRRQPPHRRPTPGRSARTKWVPIS